jgi:hypothetical protein
MSSAPAERRLPALNTSISSLRTAFLGALDTFARDRGNVPSLPLARGAPHARSVAGIDQESFCVDFAEPNKFLDRAERGRPWLAAISINDSSMRVRRAWVPEKAES